MCCDKRLTSLKKLNISLLTIVDTHTWVHDPDKHQVFFSITGKKGMQEQTSKYTQICFLWPAMSGYIKAFSRLL